MNIKTETSARSPKPTTHESRASFRPAVTPGRRSAEAGLDTLDVSERHEDARKSGSRRRDRRLVERGYE